MKRKKAEELLTENILSKTLCQLKKYRVALIDAWKESRAEYGLKQAVEDGFYIATNSEPTRFYSPVNDLLSQNLFAKLKEVDAQLAKWIYDPVFHSMTDDERDNIARFQDITGVSLSASDYLTLKKNTDEDSFKNFFCKHVWITGYRELSDKLRDNMADDNLMQFLVRKTWLKQQIEESLEVWLNNYTADDTMDIYTKAKEENEVLLEKLF